MLRHGHRVDSIKKILENSISTDGIGLSAITETRKSHFEEFILELRDTTKELRSQGDVEEFQRLEKELKEMAKMKKDHDGGKAISKSIRDRLQIKKIEGNYHCKAKVIGIDPGRTTAATWVVHDPEKQSKPMSHQLTFVDDRYEVGDVVLSGSIRAVKNI